MSNRPGKERACSAPHKTKNRPYDNRPRSGPGRANRRTQADSVVRVILPDEPPRLTPGAAAVLLRILLKAYDQIDETDNPQGDAE
jgi:hypothetical protein